MARILVIYLRHSTENRAILRTLVNLIITFILGHFNTRGRNIRLTAFCVWTNYLPLKMDNASSSIKMPPKKYYMMLEEFLLEAILKEEFVEN